MTAKLIGYSRIASMNHQGNCAGTTRPARPSSTARPKSEQVHGTTYVTRADAQAGLFEYRAPLKTHDFRADDASNRDRVLAMPIF